MERFCNKRKRYENAIKTSFFEGGVSFLNLEYMHLDARRDPTKAATLAAKSWRPFPVVLLLRTKRLCSNSRTKNRMKSVLITS
eukprot:IDg6376t1